MNASFHAHDPAPPPAGLTATQLSELVRRLGAPRILVVGDIILDRYVFGAAERISQEAPVPVFLVDREEDRLGGAASVASMLAALGAQVTLAGVIGADDAALSVRRRLDDFALAADSIVEDPSRRTTLKTRYIGRAQDRHPQQMMRADYEERRALDAALEDRLATAIERRLQTSDIILISDYAKGVCSPRLLKRVIESARARGLRVIVDPIRGSDYSRYAPPVASRRTDRNSLSAACPCPARPSAGRRRSGCASSSAARPSSSRSTRKAWRWCTRTAAARSSRRGLDRSTTSPARATWS